jgi:hypothetical protein
VKTSKNILGVLIALGFCLFIPQAAFCQTEKLGIVKYTPPPGWTKTQTGENVIVFSSLNQTTGQFCIITLCGATPGTGNPNSDFTREWNNLVVKTMKAEANPTTDTQAGDGWTAVSGGSEVESAVGKAVGFLTVISGFGKTVSVLAVFNDPAFVKQVDAFISGMDLDKTAAPANTTAAGNPAANQTNMPGRFGSMSYTAPAGWSEQKFADGVVFKPADLPANEHLAIQIMQPLNASGTMEQALEQSFVEATTTYRGSSMYQGQSKYGKNAARVSFNGWEYIRGKGGIRVQDGTQFGTEMGLEVFVIKVNNRFERVAILESRPSCVTYSQRYYSSDRLIYRTAIENLLFSLQFADLNGTPLKSGSANGNGIVGVWTGVSQSTGTTVGLRLEAFSPIFLNNGQVYYGEKFPTLGLDGLNTRIPPELYPRNWGTYTFSGGKGFMKLPYAEYPIKMQGNKLIIFKDSTDWAFSPLNSVDGATFNGTYALGAVNGRIPSITFSSDGRFTDNGALKVLHHDLIDCANPANLPGSGTYAVRDFSVIFSYSDGRKVKLAFSGAGYVKSNPSPASLRMSYHEDQLVRQ